MLRMAPLLFYFSSSSNTFQDSLGLLCLWCDRRTLRAFFLPLTTDSQWRMQQQGTLQARPCIALELRWNARPFSLPLREGLHPLPSMTWTSDMRNVRWLDLDFLLCCTWQSQVWPGCPCIKAVKRAAGHSKWLWRILKMRPSLWQTTSSICKLIYFWKEAIIYKESTGQFKKPEISLCCFCGLSLKWNFSMNN